MDETAPTVFVVDDDVHVRDALARLIRSLGMQVEAFASAREFLGCQHPDGPACLVLDVRIAGENGLRVQEALRSAAWRPPIIFLTGHGTVPMCVRAMKGGAVDFLSKPFRDQELLDAVQAGLECDRKRRQSAGDNLQLKIAFDALTAREQEIMGFVADGLMNKQIAAEIGVSEVTVKFHRGNLMRKMQATSFADLLRMAATLKTPYTKV